MSSLKVPTYVSNKHGQNNGKCHVLFLCSTEEKLSKVFREFGVLI
jgi:hypothetical protein